MNLKITTDGEYQYHLQVDRRDVHVGEKTIWFRHRGLQTLTYPSLLPRLAVIETEDGVQYVVTKLLIHSEGYIEVDGEML